MIEDMVYNFGEVVAMFVKDQKLDLLLNKSGPPAHVTK